MGKQKICITLYGDYSTMSKVLNKIGVEYTEDHFAGGSHSFGGTTYVLQPFYGRGSKKLNDLLWKLKGDYMKTSRKILEEKWSIKNV